MNIQAFPSGPFETNAYLIFSPEMKECAIIDPAPDSFDSIVNFIEANNLKPKMILLTHSHWDHIADTYPLKEKYKIPVMIHGLDAPNLEEPGTDGLPLWISITGVHPDRLLQEGDSIQIGTDTFKVIHTPGHTPGGICLYNNDRGILIAGDTLFRGSIGNISFPTSDPNQMWSSLDKLAKLPRETKVFPGHGPTTTIGGESWLPKAREIFGNY